MTTTTDLMPARPRPWLLRCLSGPRQGWSSLALLLVMLAVTGLAIDEQQWMGVGPGGASQTVMLPALMVAAGLTGALLAWSRLALGWVDLLAALIGTAAGLLLTAAAVSDAPTVAVQLQALNDSLARFLQDVLVSGSRTQETSAFLLTVSALAWTSGVFAAISIFRRSHAAGAVVSIGAMLLLEVIAAQSPQDIWLVLFAGASLLLVLRLDLEEQRDRWIRRRIGGGQGVGGLFLRGGAAVVVLMLVGSLLLTTTVSSTSLSGAFPQLDAFVADLAASVQGLVGAAPSASRGTNGEFPERRPIGNAWSTGHQAVFVAEPLDGGRHYWRAAAYDAFDGRIWRRTDSTTQEIPTGDDLLASSEDAVAEGSAGYTSVIATITSASLAGIQLPAPQNPVLLDRPARVRLMGDDGTLQVLESTDRLPTGAGYTVSGMEPAIDVPEGLTINQLLAYGSDYPESLEPLARVEPGTTGPRTMAAAKAIRTAAGAGQRDRYHLAEAIQDLLRDDPRFSYATDIRGVCHVAETVSECLLRTGVGFCQQYATTMVMMLRTLGVPARYVEGYLPGRPGIEGQFEVDASAAHAWVEVWFDTVGWIKFDPTPGDATLDENGQQPTELPLGPPVATPGPDGSPDPDATGPDETFEPLPSDQPPETAAPDASPAPGSGDLGSGGDPTGWLLVIGGIVSAALLFGVAGLLWFRRFPGREPELAWRGVISLATRLGVGPRPSQTPYEYTVALSKVVPRVARDLRVVADAKVDATYAGDASGARSPAPLRDAYRRVRLGLLRLLIRRGR